MDRHGAGETVVCAPWTHRVPKSTRIGTRKVRTGCITCKKRHVKCDEAKPSCGNCLKARGHCEGYVVKPAKGSSRRLQPYLARGASPTVQLHLDLEHHDFPESLDMLYFREFVSLVQGPWITGQSIRGGLWKVTMPQVARTNPALRHAAMAVGAMSMWYSRSGCKIGQIDLSSLPNSDGDKPCQLHAMSYYLQSLRLQSGRASIHNAILLSVLLLMFETLRGHRRTALDHVNHGMALLLSLLTGEDADLNTFSLPPNPKPLLAEVADIFTQIATQARTVVRDRVGSCPPLPNLATGLRERHLTFESFVASLSRLTSSADLERIPPALHTLDEFEEYWVAARRQQAMIGPLMLEVSQATGILTSEDEGTIGSLFPSLLADPRVVEFYDKSRMTMDALDSAFLPLFNRALLSDTDSPLYLRAVHTRLQFLAAYIFDNPPQYLDLNAMHALTSHFREFLSLAEIALREAKRETVNPAHQLSLEGGLAWNLLLVALYCRSPPVRDEAMWLLREHPGQDGLWNTHSLYALAARNRLLERANAADGTPEEQWRRLLRREYVCEDGGARVLFRFLDRNDVTGEWTLAEEVAEIHGGSNDVEWRRQVPGPTGLLVTKVVSQ